MDVAKAHQIAHRAIIDSLKVIYVEDASEPIYGFDSAKEYLFTFQLFGRSSIGSLPYMAVSRETGAVRYVGQIGE